MKNRITQADIDKIIASSKFEVRTIFDKVTLAACRLPSGFVLTESSGAVDIANYDEEQGKRICLQKIESQLWKLEGYRLSCANAE